MTYFGCKRCSKKDTVRYWFIDICWWYAKCKHWSIAHDCIEMNTFELGNSYWLAWALHLTLQIELFCDKQVCLFGQNSLKPMGNRLQTMVVTIYFFLYVRSANTLRINRMKCWRCRRCTVLSSETMCRWSDTRAHKLYTNRTIFDEGSSGSNMLEYSLKTFWTFKVIYLKVVLYQTRVVIKKTVWSDDYDNRLSDSKSHCAVDTKRPLSWTISGLFPETKGGKGWVQWTGNHILLPINYESKWAHHKFMSLYIHQRLLSILQDPRKLTSGTSPDPVHQSVRVYMEQSYFSL